MSLGLVGGLGVGATIRYYRQLVKAHAAMGSVPQLIIVHADVNHVIRSAAAGDRAGLAEYLAAILQRMANAGAQLAAIPAVLPHICAPELAGISPLPLVNLIAEVSGEIRRRELRRVALFGARSTLETRLFGAVDGLEVIQPEPPEFDFIHETYARIETDPGHAADTLSRCETLPTNSAGTTARRRLFWRVPICPWSSTKPMPIFRA